MAGGTRPWALACLLAMGVGCGPSADGTSDQASGDRVAADGTSGDGASADGAARVQVVATLPPLAWLARELGGERIEVRALLGPRSDPEAGSLTLTAARSLAEADLVVALGGGLLPLDRQLMRSLGHDGAPAVVAVIDVQGGGGRATDEAGADRPGGARAHAHDAVTDAHPWLDPDRMLAAARRLARALAEIDPAHAAEYERNLARLAARVRAADHRIRARTAGVGGGVLLSEHPTWQVLARRYGVRVLAIEEEEREPSARRLREVIESARAARVRQLVVAAGGRHRLARTVAREIDASIVELEPLAYDWLNALERAAEVAVLSASPPDRERGGTGSFDG